VQAKLLEAFGLDAVTKFFKDKPVASA